MNFQNYEVILITFCKTICVNFTRVSIKSRMTNRCTTGKEGVLMKKGRADFLTHQNEKALINLGSFRKVLVLFITNPHL